MSHLPESPRWARYSRWLLAVLFVAAGLNHFVMPEFYLRIMPDYLPWHLELVYLSGILEIILGALLLPRATRRWSAAGLILLLLAVFPANIEATLRYGMAPSDPLRVALLWIRLPLQFVLIFCIYWCDIYSSSGRTSTTSRVGSSN